MTNAAHLLADFFDHVNLGFSRIAIATRFTNEANRLGISNEELHVRAATHLSGVSKILADLEAVGESHGTYAEMLPRWRLAATGGRYGWKAPQTEAIIPNAELGILRLLAKEYDRLLPGSRSALSDADIEKFKEVLIDVADFIDSENVNPALHGWFKINLKQAQTLLETAPINTEELLRAFANVVGLLLMAATSLTVSDPKKAERFRDKAAKVSTAFLQGVAIGVTGDALTSGITALLTGA